MQGDPTRVPIGVEKRSPDEWSNGGTLALSPDSDAGSMATKERLARLARTIESELIPRLVRAHRAPSLAPGAEPVLTLIPGAPSATEASAFVDQLIRDSDLGLMATVSRLRERGLPVESIYLDLFAPAARSLGAMWEEDICDFSTVTIALGRLQRLLRELSPAFGSEIEHPSNGRRALFVQPRDEQHSFGLSMVAEFFRREGWDVIGGVGGAVAHPAEKVREEWVDVIGLSIGSDQRLDWLRDTITAVRGASRNTCMGVLVGGPLFVARPELVQQVGADGTARSAKEAPAMAESLLSATRLRI